MIGGRGSRHHFEGDFEEDFSEIPSEVPPFGGGAMGGIMGGLMGGPMSAMGGAGIDPMNSTMQDAEFQRALQASM